MSIHNTHTHTSNDKDILYQIGKLAFKISDIQIRLIIKFGTAKSITSYSTAKLTRHNTHLAEDSSFREKKSSKNLVNSGLIYS